MFNKGFLKRMLPFLATFAVGLFIASFFVTITAPSFRKSGFSKRHHEMKRLRHDNERLRNENLRLKNQVATESWIETEVPRIAHDDFRFQHRNLGPEWPVEGPPPPPRARSVVR